MNTERSESAHPWLENLNPAQLEAVLHKDGPILVLAGAGSGKTRVLTRRIANLIGAHRVRPDSILAVTFTNKAAEEMRARLRGLLGANASRVWAATFHSAALKILRMNAGLLSFSKEFSVYDDQDSKLVLKSVIKESGIPEKKIDPGTISRAIDFAKNRYIFPEESWQYFKYEPEIPDLYKRYQEALKKANAMDFGDLLCNALSLFESHPEVLKLYQNQIKYILVDEFQDTNLVQYRWLRALSAASKNLLVVGDDDQSIYSFRGADIGNILGFERDFPGAKVVKLEQNYRSTQNILSVSNAVIEKNKGRKGKTLRAEKEPGEKLLAFVANSEDEEAMFIAGQIEAFKRKGTSLEDIAIFYRTNAQSRAIEEALIQFQIPYRIYGGIKFFERKEVKDILAYLKLLLNPNDNQAFLRAVNTPARGVGAQTIKQLNDRALKERIGLFAAIDLLPTKNSGLSKFKSVLEQLQKDADGSSLSNLIRKVIERSGYLDSLKESKDVAAVSRIENLRELEALGRSMESSASTREDLRVLIDRGALTSGADEQENSDGEKRKESVSLMTLHLAKGLEFSVVFLTGVEEGLLPHYRSVDSPEGIEEERRLCYVGITRAMDHLIISRALTRGMFSSGQGFGISGYYRVPSRFSLDIPLEFLEQVGEYPFLPEDGLTYEPLEHFEEI